MNISKRTVQSAPQGGTMKSDIITPKLKGGKSTVGGSGYTVYYDLDKDAFRCFAESRLVGVVEE